MRVYELAKLVNMPNKDLLEKFHELGIEVKSHASSVDDSAVRRLYESLEKDRSASSPAPGKGKADSSPKAPQKKEGRRPPTAAASPPKAAPKKMDARAIALQKIAEAKARRHKAHQAQEPAGEKKAEEKTAKVAPSIKAPAPQRLDVEDHAPHVHVDKPQTPAPQPKSPAPRPQQPPARAKKPESPRPQQARPSRPPKPSGPLDRGKVSLEQLPSLPKRQPPPQRREGKVELAEPPAIEVMKLKPSRKPPKKVQKTALEEEKERKRLQKAKGTPGGGGHKKIRPGRFLHLDALEETPAGKKDKAGIRPRSDVLSGSDKKKGGAPHVKEAPKPKVAKIYGDVTLGELAEKFEVPATDLIAKCMELGEMLTVNKIITQDMVELLATEFEANIEIVPEGDEYDVKDLIEKPDTTPENLKPRPPVVTVMGHVDHGKTTLLDSIRETEVAEGEYGGITQHIGAYHVETDRGEVVFLDTPGHEAFTAMRARGASVTDIVILIVAADDSLMPQTIEAINHAKAAKVPILVAINKVDLPGANIQKVRNDLMQYELIGEELGGDTIICEVSAKSRLGIDHLLEMVLLQAEMLELKANPDVRAQGVVIESHVDPQRGINATILVKQGTLKNGDSFVCGDVSGRVRVMRDDRGHAVETAPPSRPVEIMGLDGCPQVGEQFLVLESERQAREIAGVREARRRRASHNASIKPHVTLEGLADYLNQDDKPKELNIILKADVQGSVEAVSQSLQRLSTEKITVQILHSAVGGINEGDIQLAMASDALVIGFNVRPDVTAQDLARSEGIDIKCYRIIYDLLEEMKAAMLGMLDKKYKEVDKGSAEIRQVFKVSRLGNIAGCFVTKGSISRNDKVRLVRDGVVVYDGELNTLRRVKDDVATVQSGYECGITLKNFQDIKEGDVLETYQMEEVSQTL